MKPGKRYMYTAHKTSHHFFIIYNSLKKYRMRQATT